MIKKRYKGFWCRVFGIKGSESFGVAGNNECLVVSMREAFPASIKYCSPGRNGFSRKIKSNLFYNCLLALAGCVIIWSVSTGCRNVATSETNITYTCPMPEDSVFSDKPGRCPKCGMDLVPVSELSPTDKGTESAFAPAGYACPMHPQIHSDEPGVCPVCGMDLERVKTGDEPLSLSLEMLLKPANQAVVANVPMVHLATREEDLEVEVFGNIEYNSNYNQRISSKISGRITKMFVKYRYQPIEAGQPLMEVYSQELAAAQNNYLFLLKNDPSNQTLIQSARQRLLLSGMSEKEVNEISRTGKAKYAITIFSSTKGVVDEKRSGTIPYRAEVAPLELKEGMYVQKGEPLFYIFNPAHARVVLQIYSQHQELVKPGNKVRIQPEANPAADFRATISEIVPYFQPESRTLTARIPFDNSVKKLPVGSTVKAIVFTGFKNAQWLPEEAVTSLGLDKVVFVREKEGFVARKIKTGLVSRHLIQILEGLKPNEAVAADAGYLIDSESFIMTKNGSK